VPPIFLLIQEEGKISCLEMYRTFNMGIGMVVVLPESEAERATDFLKQAGEEVYRIGQVRKGKAAVILR